MFCCDFEDDRDLTESLKRLNHILKGYGLRAVPLKYSKGGGRAMIYLYRPSMLGSDFEDEKVCSMLSRCGYCTSSANVCIAQLIERIKACGRDAFPHEIGLFLGYPPEDVEGFISNRASGFKLLGTWKVYGDPAGAAKKFEMFERCRQAACRQWSRTRSLDGVIAAARMAAETI